MTDNDLTDNPAQAEGAGAPTKGTDAPATPGGASRERKEVPPPTRTSSTTPPPNPPPKRSRAGRWFLLFIVVLVGLGAAGWWYLPDLRERVLGLFQDEELALRLSEADQARTALNERTGQLRTELGRLRQEVADHERTLATMRTSLAETLAALSNQGAPKPREWQLAETEYLLRMANHRLLLERDIAGARSMLEAADAVLADLGDFAFFEVRALLADEILALRTAEDIDAVSIYLRLETLKAGIDQLPLKLPEYRHPDDADSPQDAPADDGVLGRLFSLVRFRRHDTPDIRPLLSPLEAEYFEQHLRLALDRSQLLVLRRDQALFRANLRSMRTSITKHLSINDARVAALIDELDALAALNLEAVLPDISASLRRLGELRAASIPVDAPAPASTSENPDQP